jgi:hypothetical protein
MSGAICQSISMPPIGARVRYQCPRDPERTCTGTVVKHYPGYGEKHRDAETGEIYTSPDHVAIQVDKPLPPWWGYIGTDRFAPEASECEVLS